MPDPHGILKRIPPMEYVQAMGWFEPGMPFHIGDSWGFHATWVDDGQGGYRPVGRGGPGQSGGHGRHGGHGGGHSGTRGPRHHHGGSGGSGGPRGRGGYGDEDGGHADSYDDSHGGRRAHGRPGGPGGHRGGGYDDYGRDDGYDDYGADEEGIGGGYGGPSPPREGVRHLYVVRR